MIEIKSTLKVRSAAREAKLIRRSDKIKHRVITPKKKPTAKWLQADFIGS